MPQFSWVQAHSDQVFEIAGLFSPGYKLPPPHILTLAITSRSSHVSSPSKSLQSASPVRSFMCRLFPYRMSRSSGAKFLDDLLSSSSFLLSLGEVAVLMLRDPVPI